MAIRMWIIALSLAGAAFAARLHEDLTSEGMADCSPRKLSPDFSPFFGQMIIDEFEDPRALANSKKWYMYIPKKHIRMSDCKQYFVYLQDIDEFVRPRTVHYVKDSKGELHGFCSVATWKKEQNREVDICTVKKGTTTWKKAKEFVEDLCKEHLCNLAMSGTWKKWWLFNRGEAEKRAKQMPWKRELQHQGHKSYGVEDAFKELCWRGPKSSGNLLPDFDDFAHRHKLMQDGNETYFNKTVCQCRTVNDCTEAE